MKYSAIASHNFVEVKIPSARILLVEDELINRKFALNILKKFRYQVDVALNGMEAIERLTSDRYDLVLMDIQMPGMDGYEATRLIRDVSSDVLNHHVPIIAMTAQWTAADRKRCFEKGMDDYLSKPVEPKKLLEVIERQLSARSKARKETGLPADDNMYADTKTDPFEKDDIFFNKLLKMYLQRLPLQIKELKQALDEDNVGMVQEIGHTIKGGSALIEAIPLRDCAFEIENAGKYHDMESARKLVNRLEAEYDIFLKDTYTKQQVRAFPLRELI